MLHLCKVAVGVRDIAHLRDLQAIRARDDAPLRHRTRNTPRRAEHIVGVGSLYWLIGGVMRVRQRVLDVQPDRWGDDTPCTGLFLDAELIPVAARPMKPFQGWRYLEADAAPPDLSDGSAAAGEDALPVALRQALQSLCLI